MDGVVVERVSSQSLEDFKADRPRTKKSGSGKIACPSFREMHSDKNARGRTAASEILETLSLAPVNLPHALFSKPKRAHRSRMVRPSRKDKEYARGRNHSRRGIENF
jgi:hypothetical protein